MHVNIFGLNYSQPSLEVWMSEDLTGAEASRCCVLEREVD
jgi:hypothetical protein